MKVPTRLLNIAAIAMDRCVPYGLDRLQLRRIGRKNVAIATDRSSMLVAAWRAGDNEISEEDQAIPVPLVDLAKHAAIATQEDGVVFGTNESSGCYANGTAFDLRTPATQGSYPETLTWAIWPELDGTQGVSVRIDAKRLCTLLQTMMLAMHEPDDELEPMRVTMTVVAGGSIAFTTRSGRFDIAALLSPMVNPCDGPAWNPLDLVKE